MVYSVLSYLIVFRFDTGEIIVLYCIVLSYI